MCKLFLPQHTEWRVEHGGEAEGGLTDRKGEPRRKRPRFELQTEALPPGGRFMRVRKGSAICEAQEGQKATRSTRSIAKVIKAVGGLGARRVLG